MESRYKLEYNDLQLLYRPGYHVENLDEIISNGVIQLTGVEYFQEQAFIVTGTKPGCSETIKFFNPNAWLARRKVVDVFIEEVIKDEKCSVLVGNTYWTPIKVCNKSEVQFKDLQGIEARNIIELRVENDDKNSVIKVRGIQAGTETLQWSSYKRLMLFDVWERATISSVCLDDFSSYNTSRDYGNDHFDYSEFGRNTIYQNRWNKIVSVPNNSCLRVRGMGSINYEANFRVSVDDKGKGPGVYVKPKNAAVGETLEIEWSNEFYWLFSQIPTMWSRESCIVQSNINETTAPEENFILEACKVIQQFNTRSERCSPESSRSHRRSDTQIASGNPFLKYMKGARGSSSRYPLDTLREVERFKQEGVKPKDYLVNLFPSEGYIKSLFCLLDQLLCCACVNKQSLKHLENLSKLADNVLKVRIKDLTRAAKRKQKYERNANQNRNKISEESKSISSHLYAKDAWKIISKILSDVIQIMKNS